MFPYSLAVPVLIIYDSMLLMLSSLFLTFLLHVSIYNCCFFGSLCPVYLQCTESFSLYSETNDSEKRIHTNAYVCFTYTWGKSSMPVAYIDIGFQSFTLYYYILMLMHWNEPSWELPSLVHFNTSTEQHDQGLGEVQPTSVLGALFAERRKHMSGLTCLWLWHRHDGTQNWCL